MSDLLNHELYRAAAMVFEELGFMLTNYELEDHQVDLPVQASVAVGFHGPLEGTLLISVYGDLLPTLAANMLGEDEATERQQSDALGEIANVICGNLLPALAGFKAVFKLGSPVSYVGKWEDEGTSWHACDEAARAQIGLEDGRADVFLLINGGPACLPERYRNSPAEA